MEASLAKLVLVFLIYHGQAVAVNSMYDCWDQEKLAKMKFKESRDEQNDPNLSQFSKLLKCIQKQQGQTDGNFGQMDFNQWDNVARGGQFPPGWNYPNGQPPPQWGRPGDRADDYGRRQPPNQPPPQYPPYQPSPTGQPRPGVHPDDWNNARDPINPDIRWSTAGYDDEDRDDNLGQGRGDRKNRRKNKNNRNKERIIEDGNTFLSGPSIPPEMIDDRTGPWNNDKNDDNQLQHQPQPGSPIGRDFMMVDDEDVSLHRKYGYAIMALSVVVLAVLMVSTIFCCNSSNSTMNQPAVQTVPISQIDNYSIYSYKQGAIPADTLLSTG